MDPGFIQGVQLFEGNRDALDRVDPAPEVPRTITERLGAELTEPHQTVASYGGVGGGSRPMHHSQGWKKDEADIDAERFFRWIEMLRTPEAVSPRVDAEDA